MKKITVYILLAALLLPCVCALSAFSEETPPGAFDEALCDAVKDGIVRGLGEIDVSSFGLNVSDAERFIEHIRYDDPEFFYLERCTYTYSGDHVLTLRPQYDFSEDTLEEAVSNFEAMVGEVCALADGQYAPRELILFYHDLFTKEYSYDPAYTSKDVYSFLAEKKGVCQAYALTFMLIMRRFGIPCTYVCSEKMNHMWNAVYVDGTWYHVDLTYDDPAPDRPGQVCRDHFLTGTATTALLKPEADDLIFGEEIAISAKDHPLRSVLLGSLAPAVEVGGKWYGILKTGERSTALCQFGFNSSELVAHVSFPYDPTDGRYYEWSVPEGAGNYYRDNFSGLCTDGRYLYFNDSKFVYVYDPERGREPVVIGGCAEDLEICGLRLIDGDLVIYVADAPDAGEYVPVTVRADLPVYYTVTWVIGEECIVSYAEEGSDPEDSFFGSTYKEEEFGVRYIFAGWSPETVPVTEDAVYTALYDIEKLYIDGDVNDDGAVTISDVTALLDCLSGYNDGISFWAADLTQNGSLEIGDVTALLDLLAGKEPEEYYEFEE